MPLVRISLLKGKSPAHIKAIADGVHAALVETYNVPPDDRFQLVQQHERGEFFYDPSFAGVHRTDELVFMNIVAAHGRTLQQKQALYKAIARNLADKPGLRQQDVLIVISPNDRDEWSFGNGLATFVKEAVAA
jgi:phenylpyruvate tautomerase PptA (4-oxalocrotonate tautomerase family)